MLRADNRSPFSGRGKGSPDAVGKATSSWYVGIVASCHLCWPPLLTAASLISPWHVVPHDTYPGQGCLSSKCGSSIKGQPHPSAFHHLDWPGSPQGPHGECHWAEGFAQHTELPSRDSCRRTPSGCVLRRARRPLSDSAEGQVHLGGAAGRSEGADREPHGQGVKGP